MHNIPDIGFNGKVINIIENKIREKTGSAIALKWVNVNNISPSLSGKPQIIINNLVNNK
jgi:hypothetical protein